MAGEGTRMTLVDGRGAPEAAGEINEVDEQVVDRKQQEADARKQRQLGREAAEDFGNGHGADASG